MKTELTREQAITLAQSDWWKGKSDREIAEFQLFTDLLCMPFGRFHEAVEKSLGRPVWTHEFAGRNIANLHAEFLGTRQAPTFEQICALIPAEKRIVIGLGS